MTNRDLPVAVIGAGPVGLAAAAHLAERGIPFVVLEASVGVAASFASVAHVRLFSPWQSNVDAAAVRMLTATGWSLPTPEAMPTAGELRQRYLEPLAALMRDRIRYGARVVAITRRGHDKVKTDGRDKAPFLLRLSTAEGSDEVLAQAVIDASGTWANPNPLGADGLPAIGEREFASRIVHGMPDVSGAERARYAGKTVLVAGAGHSAAGSLIALAELATTAPGTRIIWTTRGENLTRVFGGGDRDGLPARGRLGRLLRELVESGRLALRRNFRTIGLRERDGRIDVLGEGVDGAIVQIEGVDEIIAATGSRPDLSLARELRLNLDPWLESTEALAPLIDPNLHSCGSVPPHGHRELAHPEVGFYVVGAKSYGRAPNFLLATGYEQVRSVVAALAGDLTAADDVQLVIPETGVCRTDLDKGASGCCALPEKSQPAAACCSPGPTESTPRPRSTASCCG